MADLLVAGYLIVTLVAILPIFRAFLAADGGFLDDDMDRYLFAVVAVACAPLWPVGLVAWAVVRCGGSPPKGKR